jgi:hypothetical protein
MLGVNHQSFSASVKIKDFILENENIEMYVNTETGQFKDFVKVPELLRSLSYPNNTKLIYFKTLLNYIHLDFYIG